MRTIKQVSVKPFYCEGTMMPFEMMEEGIIYISEKYQTSIHKCLCGCGEEVVLPFCMWSFIKEKEDKISFTPSVGNYNFPCKSHYIITKNVANFV